MSVLPAAGLFLQRLRADLRSRRSKAFIVRYSPCSGERDRRGRTLWFNRVSNSGIEMTIKVTIINSDTRDSAVIAVEVEPLQYQTDTGIEQKNMPMVRASPFRELERTELKAGQAREFWVHEFQRLRVSEVKQ